jgi:hypothetical protein
MVTVNNASSSAPAKTTKGAPILIDLGKQRRKAIKALRRGDGVLMEEIGAALDKLRASGAVAEGAQMVVVVVRPKKRRLRGLLQSL